jgi:hypothetical protein
VLLCCCVSEQPNFFYWDALEMLRKALITGVIMFVSKGSLFQIVVALFFSLGFAFSAAWCQPYANQKANMYKVAVEISLIATLTLGLMLRFDLSTEELMTENVVGWMMLLANTVRPWPTKGDTCLKHCTANRRFCFWIHSSRCSRAPPLDSGCSLSSWTRTTR